MKKLRVTVNGTTYDVEVEIFEDEDQEPRPYHLTPSPSVTAVSEISKATPSVVSNDEKGLGSVPNDKKELTSPIAGTVLEIKTAKGSVVEENELLLVIEAMKMHVNISSPVSGTIKSIEVAPKDGVRQGQLLLTFESLHLEQSADE
jgi:biotin carboxyl carrier protein